MLSGCSIFQGKQNTQPQPLPLPPVKVITETVQLEIYQPPMPPPIQLDEVKWFVLTEKNMQEKIEEIKKLTGSEFAVFVVTPQSYENMAYNLQEIRRYMRQQTEIIKYYKEATKLKGPSGWLEENKEKQTTQLEIEQSNNQPVVAETPAAQDDGGFFSKLLPKF